MSAYFGSDASKTNPKYLEDLAEFRKVIALYAPTEEKNLNEDQKKRLLKHRLAVRKLKLDQVNAFEMNCLISEIASGHALKDEVANDAFLKSSNA